MTQSIVQSLISELHSSYICRYSVQSSYILIKETLLLLLHGGQLWDTAIISKFLWSSMILSNFSKSQCYLIDGLVQACSNSNVLAMELLQSCTRPLRCPGSLHHLAINSRGDECLGQLGSCLLWERILVTCTISAMKNIYKECKYRWLSARLQ